MADAIKPFKIAVPDADLEDLRERLRRTRFPGELEGVGNEMGAPLKDVKRLATHWAEKYDWRAAEAKLNAWPHFTTSLQADGFEPLDVHFIHVRSAREDAIPLLFVHGWPGSFLEATKILGPLSSPPDASQPAFHVVAPSLLGYGFSQASKKPGFGADQHGEVFHKLMLRLGYEEYATQGGDWGCMITRAMGRRYAPTYIKAQHLNLDHYPQPSLMRNPLTFLRTMVSAFVTGFSERDKKGFERSKWFRDEGSGYHQVQGTRPQTLGYALTDSPVALLGWIYEKLVDWTDSYPWTEDEVCTWISIYWFSKAGPRAAHQLYYEVKHAKATDTTTTLEQLGEWQDLKIGLSHFPKDVIILPGWWAHVMGNVVFDKNHEKGGHFAAWECPDELVGDLREMFTGGAKGAVKIP
ncbi:microsomal epoxide hydrolase [Xylaria bambusicola]|uniref:microsomal epoxide hydrolase n=1 Tax=Xylaria bambusicola TaxID=326684 RepID=UPI0020087775|nr:microsomal epoxide hydrolase [Xylaria bambusicola]KAI0506880.1 microsomal epoxide hydrolase [Xylaria bambusicola]